MEKNQIVKHKYIFPISKLIFSCINRYRRVYLVEHPLFHFHLNTDGYEKIQPINPEVELFSYEKELFTNGGISVHGSKVSFPTAIFPMDTYNLFEARKKIIAEYLTNTGNFNKEEFDSCFNDLSKRILDQNLYKDLPDFEKHTHLLEAYLNIFHMINSVGYINLLPMTAMFIGCYNMGYLDYFERLLNIEKVFLESFSGDYKEIKTGIETEESKDGSNERIKEIEAKIQENIDDIEKISNEIEQIDKETIKKQDEIEKKKEEEERNALDMTFMP